MNNSLLLLTDADEELVKAIGHDKVHTNEIVDWFKATNWKISLPPNTVLVTEVENVPRIYRLMASTESANCERWHTLYWIG